MKLNTLEFVLMNNPVRAASQQPGRVLAVELNNRHTLSRLVQTVVLYTRGATRLDVPQPDDSFPQCSRQLRSIGSVEQAAHSFYCWVGQSLLLFPI